MDRIELQELVRERQLPVKSPWFDVFGGKKMLDIIFKFIT